MVIYLWENEYLTARLSQWVKYVLMHTASLGRRDGLISALVTTSSPSLLGEGLMWWRVLRSAHLAVPNDAVRIFSYKNLSETADLTIRLVVEANSVSVIIPWIWKDVSATLWSGRYSLPYPRRQRLLYKYLPSLNVAFDMEGCICHFGKWQIHPSISKATHYIRDISF